jgi:protease IV
MRPWFSAALTGAITSLAALLPAHAQTATYGMITIEGAPAPRPGPLDWLFGRGDNHTLRDLVDGIDASASADDLAGLVIRLKDAQLSPAQVEELGAAIKRARAHGRTVHVFAESFGPADLMLASYADKALGQPGGAVSLPGLYMEEMFLADTLAWAGLKADMVQVGDYKGASEAMARSAPSPQWEQNISQLLDSLYAHMRATLADGRSLSAAQLDAAMSALWMGDMNDAVKAGLIDAQVDLATLASHLAGGSGDVEFDLSLVGEPPEDPMQASNPLLMLQKLSAQPDVTPQGPAIAIVHIDGAIVDGDSSIGGLTGEPTVGSRTIRNALEQILDEDLIKGVVIRIDSPGGSATASEMIWQGIRRVASRKPVWVSVGGMAASGGYYCAVAGDRVFVNRASIVGSIGVVGGKIAMHGLYDKLKVNVVPRTRGPRADMLSSLHPWTDDQRALVHAKMTQTYDLFTSRVAQGRKGIDLAATAEGRLFTGDKALALGMADDIGGLHDAISSLASSLNLGEYEVLDFPGPRALGEVIDEALSGFVHAPALAAPPRTPELASAARALMGEPAWRQVAPAVTGFLELRDQRVLLLSPRALIFR